MQRPLTEFDLFPRGPLHRLGRRVRLFSEIDSTNTYLLTHAAELGDGAVTAAEFQTAGRGRQRRVWLAPRGSSLLLSFLLIEPESSPLIPHATMLAALAMSEAVETETGCRPGLRWPNDLIVEGKKLGGVLAESTPQPDYLHVVGRAPPAAHHPEQTVSASAGGQTKRALVVGIGLNCLQQPGHFGSELGRSATSLEIECSQPISRAGLARRLIERLDADFAHGRSGESTWEWLRQGWTARCDDLGTRVTLEEDSRRYTGTVLEIVDNGDLIVQLDSGGRKQFGSTTTTRIQ